jgi:hypothetical protein
MTNEERYKRALEEIHYHFDDQSFVHNDKMSCEEVLVNYSGAVLDGCNDCLSEWYERFCKEVSI